MVKKIRSIIVTESNRDWEKSNINIAIFENRQLDCNKIVLHLLCTNIIFTDCRLSFFNVVSNKFCVAARMLQGGSKKTPRRLQEGSKEAQRRLQEGSKEAQRSLQGGFKEAPRRLLGGSKKAQRRLKEDSKEAQRSLQGDFKKAPRSDNFKGPLFLSHMKIKKILVVIYNRYL